MFISHLILFIVAQDLYFHFLILQGKGEFTMEYKEHLAVSNDVQMQLVNTYKGTKEAE